MTHRICKMTVLAGLLCLFILLVAGCGTETPAGTTGALLTKAPAVTTAVPVTEAPALTTAVPVTEAPVPTTSAPVTEAPVEDFASSLKLDMNSGSLKQSVTVKLYVDGDTTHFYVPDSVVAGGVLKARYIAINTPESTGKIEEYGKKASNFTKSKLSSASSIIIESDDNKWNVDSTGGRYLVWIWYRTNENEDYRNLNVEILQNGLAIASSSANNRYGETCMSAIAQAKRQKLNVYSGEKDPDMYYGEAVELTLKELRTHIDKYNNIKVAFEGVITRNSENTVYVEDFDPETGLYFGITVYYGYNLNGAGLSIISVGNRARIVGTVQYYEAGGTYQVSDLSYKIMKPKDPSNLQKISEGNSPAYVLTTPATFAFGKVQVEDSEGNTKEIKYGEAVLSTSIRMENLKVNKIYTTVTEGSASYGAMTLTCEADGVTVKVRTAVLYDENGFMITEDAYEGKTVNVQGIVEYFNGSYQIKVFTPNDIEIVR